MISNLKRTLALGSRNFIVIAGLLISVALVQAGFIAAVGSFGLSSMAGNMLWFCSVVMAGCMWVAHVEVNAKEPIPVKVKESKDG